MPESKVVGTTIFLFGMRVCERGPAVRALSTLEGELSGTSGQYHGRIHGRFHAWWLGNGRRDCGRSQPYRVEFAAWESVRSR